MNEETMTAIARDYSPSERAEAAEILAAITGMAAPNAKAKRIRQELTLAVEFLRR